MEFTHQQIRIHKRTAIPHWDVTNGIYVHVVFELAAGESLEALIHSWKSFSAKEANRMLGRHGAFWQGDYFDRTIRNRRELENTIAYVTENPFKAGLKEWPWVKRYDSVIAQYF